MPTAMRPYLRRTECSTGPVARSKVATRSGEFMASGTYDLTKLNFKPAQTPDGKPWPSTVRHLVTNQVIEIDGDMRAPSPTG